ncbi:MAG: hypothetical protein KDC49_12550 [Saprospiraceae bacterium]|nr:hypothetical protein [Saprospiraceae bacterium]
MNKIFPLFVFLISIYQLSCIDSYSLDELTSSTYQHFIVGYIGSDLSVKIKYDYVNTGSAIQKRDSGVTLMVLMEDGIDYDTLHFSYGQQFGHYLEYNPTYSSSDPSKFPRNGHEYSVKVIKGDQLDIFSFGKFPEYPLVDSVNLDVNVLQFNNNRTDFGAIYLSPLDRSNYIAFYGIHSGKFGEVSSTEYSDRNIEYQLSSENYCGALKVYFPDNYFSSAKLDCLNPSSKVVRFSDSNIGIEDSIKSSKIIVCNLRDDLANFYGSREQYFEGTEFFFSPSRKLPFTIEDEGHIGILSSIACKEIDVQLR